MSRNTKLDERGRVVIPHKLREKLKLRPSQKLKAEARGSEIVLRAAVDTDYFIKEMKGWASRSKVKPEDLKEIWTLKHSPDCLSYLDLIFRKSNVLLQVPDF